MGRIAILVISLLLASLSVHAQDAPSQEDYALSEIGQRYLSVARRAGVEAQMAYFDPTKPPPEMKLDQPLPEQSEEPEETLDASPVVTLITVLILAAIVLLVARYGGAVSLSLRDKGREAAVGADAGAAAALFEGRIPELVEIAGIADRRLALIALLAKVLHRAAEDSAMAIERSWTAREAQRRLPADWPHRAFLGDLIRTVELTHFGGRPAEETVFQTHLANARSILARAS